MIRQMPALSFSFVVLGSLLVGCRAKPEPPPLAAEDDSRRDVAVAAKDELFQRLSGRLMEVIQTEGPAAAIRVCSQEAGQIAEEVAEEQGVRIGRTSLKLRNSKNQPPEWAEPLLDDDLIEPTFLDLPSGKLGALLPIKLMPQCLLCHGPKTDMPVEIVRQLGELYPDDQATGFKEGDLRGWFWVEVPKAEPQGNQDEKSTTFIQHGRMREVIGAKQHHGRVTLARVIDTPNLYAVGALEGLRGEVTIVDSKIVATEVGADQQLRSVEVEPELQATLLVGGQVSSWSSHVVADDVAAEAFDEYLESIAGKQGIDTSRPFVFAVEGEFSDVRFHVIHGACPVHAKRSGVELVAEERPFEGRYQQLEGALVGVFAKDAVGELTHPGTSTHTHLVFQDPEIGASVTGHVEQIGLSAGTVIKLPSL